MRVLLLFEVDPVGPYIPAAVQELRMRDIEVVFATLGPAGETHRVLSAAGIDTAALGLPRRAAYPLAIPSARRLIKRFEPGVVHCHEILPSVVGGLARGRQDEPVVVFHRHHARTRRRSGVWASRMAARVTDLTVAVSRASAEHAANDDHTKADRIEVVYNGVTVRTPDEREIETARSRVKADPGEPIVLVVGRMRKVKGHDLVLEAARYMERARGQRIHIAMVGAGPEHEALRRRAKSATGATVHLIGHQADVAPWYALADVIVQPSVFDAFPLTVIEAMAHGKAVVGARVGGIPEAVEHKVTGLLVDGRDPRTWADAITRVLEEPELKQRMGAAGYHRYEQRFSTARMIDGWIDAYQTALRKT